MDCRTALATVLDSVDYTTGNCRPNEMVGAVLPKEMIVMARQAIAEWDKFHAIGMATIAKVYEEFEGNLTPDAADGAKAGETLRYWQHDETGRQCARAQRPSPRWFEITQGQYDGSDDDYPAKPPRR